MIAFNKKQRVALRILVVVLLFGWIPVWIIWDQIGDRSIMYEKYDQVKIGSRLGEVEALIGTSDQVYFYDHTNVPKLVKGDDAVPQSSARWYVGQRYILLIHYDPKTEAVVGKGLLRTSRSTLWVDRLIQDFLP